MTGRSNGPGLFAVAVVGALFLWVFLTGDPASSSVAAEDPTAGEMMGRYIERYRTGPTWCMIALPIMTAAMWISVSKRNFSPTLATGITIKVALVLFGYATPLVNLVESIEASAT